MRIAICDGDIKAAESTKKAVYGYAATRNLDLLVEIYDSGSALLQSGTDYMLIILEYNTKGTNGLETAEKLRERNCRSTIVFLSAYTEFVFDAFKVMPYRFLCKPLENGQLFSVLDDFFVACTERPLWIKNGNDTFCLSSEDIFYLEADNKNCYIGLKNRKLRCKKTMERVFGTLPKNRFCKINRAYIVNFNYISAYNSDMIALTNGERLHISRSYYKSFREEYRSFADPYLL